MAMLLQTSKNFFNVFIEKKNPHISGPTQFKSIHFVQKSAVVIYCCVTVYPKVDQLKTANSIYLTVSLGEEYERPCTRCFWLKVSHEIIM